MSRSNVALLALSLSALGLSALSLSACGGGSGSGPGNSPGDGAGGGTAGAGALDGDADDGALDAIPDINPDAYDDETHIEWEGDVAIATDRIVLGVEPDATVGQINAALAALEASILGGTPDGGLLVLAVPPGSARDAVEAAPDLDGVAMAQLDFTMEAERLGEAHDAGAPADLASCSASNLRWRWDDDDTAAQVPSGQWDAQGWIGVNWGLKFGRVPLAWNLRDHMVRQNSPPGIGFVDQGFSVHSDLPGLPVQTGDAGQHALGVASVAAASFDDGRGIEGVFPRGTDLNSTLYSAWYKDTSVQMMWSSRTVTQAARLVGQGARIVNLSFGMSAAYLKPDADPAVLHALVEGEGRTWAAAGASLTSRGHVEFLATCSAGNSGPTYPAKWNSGCGFLADAGESHFISVESLRSPGDTLASTSGTGATVAAPGHCVGMAHPGANWDWYASSGTSFAAPYAAGVAAMVWAADPGLGHGLVRSALISGAHPTVAGIAPRLDAFGALMYIDTLKADRVMAAALADIDDTTPDGNLRLAPDGSELSATGADDGLRGDGCVDIRDLRVLRDAIMDTRPGDEGAALNGPADHFNRDLNGDGVVLPGDAGTFPDDADKERLWSRYDLNGDLRVDEADVDVMAQVWGYEDGTRCTSADTHGIPKSDLQRWVQSVDVWMNIPEGTEPYVLISGGQPTQAQADNQHGPWHMQTALLPCAGSHDVKACLRDDSTGTTELSCSTFLTGSGADELVREREPVVSAEGLVFLSRDHGIYTNPLTIYRGTGGAWGDGVDLPDSEDLTATSGLQWTMSSNGEDLMLAGCDGESLEDQAGSACISRVNARSGGRTVTTPEAGLTGWRLQDAAADGRLLWFARSADLNDHFFVIDEQRWDFSEAEVIADQWSSAGPLLYTSGRVASSGGIDEDTDSNGIHVSTTHPVVDWDADIEAAVCLAYGDHQTSDVSRSIVPNGPAVSVGGLLITRPFGTTTPGTGVRDPLSDRFLELDAMTAEYAAWSPDGRALAFGAWNEGTRVVTLADGDDWDDLSMAVIDDIPLVAGTMRWAPDGTRLFILDNAGLAWGETDVWIYDATSGEVSVLEDQVEVAGGSPSWSPDGGSIATTGWFTDTIVCDGSPVDVRHLDVITTNLNTSVTTRATAGFVELNPAWPECGAGYPTNEWGSVWR
jgi:hypothetical protein